MSDASPHAFPYVTRTIDGKEVKFGKWTPKDRASVLSRMRSALRSRRLQNAKDAGLPAEQIFAELEDVDATPFGQAEWLDYLNAIQGRVEVCVVAYFKHNAADATAFTKDPLAYSAEHLSVAQPAIDAVLVTDPALCDLVGELCNVSFGPPKGTEPTKEGDESGNPQPPPAT